MEDGGWGEDSSELSLYPVSTMMIVTWEMLSRRNAAERKPPFYTCPLLSIAAFLHAIREVAVAAAAGLALLTCCCCAG